MKTKHKNNMDDQWDDRTLGATAKYARKLPKQDEQAIDDALNLSIISIRLQKELINNLKTLAKEEGIGYQPLIRQVLTHYVRDRRVNTKHLTHKKNARF